MIPANIPFDILLVEDDPGDAMLTRHALTSVDFPVRVHHVKDGVECMQFLHREAPDFADAPRPRLILLDLNMPRMDGRAVLAAIKQDRDLHAIPVVVLTTSDFEQDIVRSYDLGANSFMTKPVDVEHFFRSLRDIETYWAKVISLPH